jgi:Ca2+/H+ antiporter, TMEM165/GDT1 family
VLAGSLITLLPRRPVEAIVSALFLAGALALWRTGGADTDEDIVGEPPANVSFGRIRSRVPR